MKNKWIKYKKGFTLIELLIVLALTSIVLAGAFSMFSFGNKTFKGGSSQSNLQTDVRFALEALTNDVRYATSLNILQVSDFTITNLLSKDINGIYHNIDSYDTYIFYDNNTKSVVRLRRESIESFHLNTDATVPLEFSPIGSPVNRLEFYLRGVNSSDSKNFEVTSQILMLNIIKPDGTSGVTGTSGGVGIKYVTPESHIAELQYPVTQLIGVNDEKKVEITFDKLIKLEDFKVSPGSNTNQLTKNHVIITPNSTSTNKLTIVFHQTDPKPKQFVDQDRITLILQYGPLFEYHAYYDLVFIGGGTKSWTIE